MKSEHMSVPEAGRLLRKTSTQVYSMVQRGELAGGRNGVEWSDGPNWYVERSAVRAYLAKKQSATATGRNAGARTLREWAAELPENALISVPDLAKRLMVSQATLQRWRTNGTGPVFIRAGLRVLYREGDVAAWLTSRARTSTT